MMRKSFQVSALVVVVPFVAALACSGEDGKAGQDGTPCTIEKNADGSKTLTCPDGTSVTFSDAEQGPAGPRGPQGDPGEPGEPGQIGRAHV